MKCSGQWLWRASAQIPGSGFVLARTDRRLYQLIIRQQIAVESLFSIVVVEDHDEYREALVEFLQREGHRVMDFDSAETLMHGALPESVDLFMIDLNLPGEDGLVLAKRLRESMPAVGIIMLTARGYPEDVTRGYQNGADIYLNKPASAAQLRAALGLCAEGLVAPRQGKVFHVWSVASCVEHKARSC
ncbi:response regulator transcription factor [Orrella marina]|uniref:response regulator transcription factor n=1 Tax=Orrella marina TaxID=2163011 RepID=UPI00131EF763|nr:response regulator [Orrella marina]